MNKAKTTEEKYLLWRRFRETHLDTSSFTREEFLHFFEERGCSREFAENLFRHQRKVGGIYEYEKGKWSVVP